MVDSKWHMEMEKILGETKMSGFYAVNLSKHKVPLKGLKELSYELVEYVITKKIGIHFNPYDYMEDIIKNAGMKDFFVLSSSFLHKNFDYIEDTSFISDFSDVENSWIEFVDYLGFLNDINNVIFSHNVSEIEVFLSSGEVTDIEGFIEKETDKQNFLRLIFNSIYEFSDFYSYGFPSLRVKVCKN